MSKKTGKSRKLSSGAQAALVAVGLVVLAAAGYFLLVSPKKSEAAEIAKEVEVKRAEMLDLRAKSLVEQPEPIDVSDLFRLAKAMPDTTDMPGILLELNRVASESGIVFESITPAGGTKVGTYQVVPVSLVFQGNFYSLSDFLFRLRNLVHLRDGELAAGGRLFSVDSINFGPGEGGFPAIQASLQVNAFVYGTGAPATAAPAPTETTTTTTTTEPSTTTPDPSEPPAAPTAAAAPTG